MKIKDLQQSADLIKRLEVLENELNDLQKFALKVKDKSITLKLNLSYENPASESVRFDEDGSMTIGLDHSYFPSGGLMGFLGRRNPTSDNKETYGSDVNEVLTLEILGVIAAHKEAEIMYIIQQLKRIGITIE